MKVSLKNIADLQFGFYTQSVENGSIPYLQVKHFNESGKISSIDSFINMEEVNQKHLLQDGDILFVGKGFRIFAWCYRSDFGQAFASSIFFVIRPDQNKVFPEFLTTLFNLPKNISYFQQLGAGSSIPSIRKNELAEFKINLIPLEKQMKVATLYELHQKEIELQINIMNKKNELFQNVVSRIMSYEL